MYSTELKKRYLGRNHLIKQLHANQLLNDSDTNCEVMNECLQEIIPLFGIKSILSLIISNAKEHKLQSICDIISRQKRKYKDKPLPQNESKDNNNEEAIPVTTPSLFSSLSKVSLSHIIDYLDRHTIERIKIISRKFGIICLEQMNKISIGIFNLNYLLQNQQPLQLDTIYNNKINCNRYNSNVKYSLLYEQWADKYNIPEQYQLIFGNIGCPVQCGIASAKQFDADAFTDTKIKKNDFLLVDKRNIICFDGNNFKKLMDLHENDHKLFSKILVLEYFDVIDQRLQTLQFIVYNHNINISMMKTYIKSKYIPMGNDILQEELQKQLLVMNNSVSQLIFYKHGPQGGLSKAGGSVNSMRLTFELNCKQITIKQKINPCKIESEKRLIPFAMNTKEFYKNNYVKTTYVYLKKNKSFLLKNKERFNVKIKSKIYPLVLQNKIAKSFDGLINPKCVALLQSTYINGESGMRLIDLKQPMDVSYNLGYFELLTFDAELYNHSVSVNIFKPSECPHPIYNKYKKGISLRLVMIDKQECTTQEFINYIFATIRDMERNHILYKYYKEVFDIFDNLDSSKCCLVNSISENKILTTIQRFNICSKNELLSVNCNEFDLFLNGAVSINESSPISLKIKFYISGDINECVGMDLNVNINKSDSLQEIISKSINNIDKFGHISCCVRANNDKNWRRWEYIEVIQPSEFNEYKPYYKFIRNNPTDFVYLRITPKIQNENMTNVCLPLSLYYGGG